MKEPKLKKIYYHTEQSIAAGVVLVKSPFNDQTGSTWMIGYLCDNKKIRMPKWDGFYDLKELTKL